MDLVPSRYVEPSFGKVWGPLQLPSRRDLSGATVQESNGYVRYAYLKVRLNGWPIGYCTDLEHRPVAAAPSLKMVVVGNGLLGIITCKVSKVLQ